MKNRLLVTVETMTDKPLRQVRLRRYINHFHSADRLMFTDIKYDFANPRVPFTFKFMREQLGAADMFAMFAIGKRRYRITRDKTARLITTMKKRGYEKITKGNGTEPY